MKLWLDDIRTPPDTSWTWVRTVEEAIDFIGRRPVQVASLDNDLGEGQTEGRRLVLWMAEFNNWPGETRVHSANPVAADYMRAMIERYGP